MIAQLGLVMLLARPGILRAETVDRHVIVSIALRHSVYDRLKKIDDVGERRKIMHDYDTEMENAAKAFVDFYRVTHPEVVDAVHLGFGLYNFVFKTADQAKVARKTILNGCQLLLSGSEFEISTAANSRMSAI